MARYGQTITVQAGQIPSSQSNFVWLATEVNFPTAAIDGGSTSILNGGGNLRCYTDDTKTTQLPIEVVTFVTGVTPSVEVWGLSPTLEVGGTVYVEADPVAVSQPPVTDTYGRNSVWVDFLVSAHLQELSGDYTNSTGGANGTLDGGTMTSDGWDSLGGKNGVRWGVLNLIGGFTVTAVYETNTATHPQWVVPFSQREVGLGFQQDWHVQRNQTFNNFRAEVGGSGSNGGIFNDTVTTGITHRLTFTNGTNDLLLHNGTVNATFSLSVNSTSTYPVSMGSDGREAAYNAVYKRFFVRDFDITQDLDTAEYNNQSSPSLFWSTGVWEDQDAGGGFQSAWAANANQLINMV